jgi:orotate phosphoribosyltransferase
VAIFNYGFDTAVENFKQAKCKFYTVSNYNALLKYAEKHQYISAADTAVLKQWRTAPSTWGQ